MEKQGTTLLHIFNGKAYMWGPYEICLPTNLVLILFFITFYTKFGIRECVQHAIFHVFHMGFRPQVVLARIHVSNQ